MSEFKLSARSLSRLTGVHPDLQKVVMRAIQISPVDFAVLGGIRTEAEQRRLVAAGKSQTMNSRHLTGHAVDLGVYIAKQGVVWDWLLYRKLATAMKRAAKQKGVPIEWGGDWRFKDGPHFQLPWADYPIDKDLA